VLGHEEAAVELLFDLISETAPDLIIEFGTASFGFTLLAHEAAPKATVITYDSIDPMEITARNNGFTTPEEIGRVWKEGLQGQGVFFNQADLMQHDKQIELLMKDPRRKLFYCDNGNKVMEVDMYAPFLNPGDMLGVHDWPNEINEKMGDVAWVLSHFDEAPINSSFIAKGCSSRFFIKRV
jgi:hypothetical protein